MRSVFTLLLCVTSLLSCHKRDFGEKDVSTTSSLLDKVEFSTGEVKGQIRALDGLKLGKITAYLSCAFADGSGSLQRNPKADLVVVMKDLPTPVGGGSDSLYEVVISAGKVKYQALLTDLKGCDYVLSFQKADNDAIGGNIQIVSLNADKLKKPVDVTELVLEKLKPLTVKAVSTVIVEDTK